MRKSVEVRKRKAVERMRLRAQVAEGKVRPEDIAVPAAVFADFYQRPFSVDHIRLHDATD